jgi:serine/threonine protein kinase
MLCLARAKLSDHCKRIENFDKLVGVEKEITEISILKKLEVMGKGSFGEVWSVLAQIPGFKDPVQVAVKREIKDNEALMEEILVYLALEKENKRRRENNMVEHMHIPSFFGCLYTGSEESQSFEENKMMKEDDPRSASIGKENEINASSGRMIKKADSLREINGISSHFSSKSLGKENQQLLELQNHSRSDLPSQGQPSSSGELANSLPENLNPVYHPIDSENNSLPNPTLSKDKKYQYNNYYHASELTKLKDDGLGIFMILELFEGSFKSFENDALLPENEKLTVLDPVVRVDVYQQMMAGIAELHEAGIIHQDVKENNFGWRKKEGSDKGERVVKIFDYGLSTFHGRYSTKGAKIYRDQIKIQIDEDSLAYDQSTLENRKDHFLTDVHALGVMIYRMENDLGDSDLFSDKKFIGSCLYFRKLAKNVADKEWVIRRKVNLCDK